MFSQTGHSQEFGIGLPGLGIQGEYTWYLLNIKRFVPWASPCDFYPIW